MLGPKRFQSPLDCHLLLRSRVHAHRLAPLISSPITAAHARQRQARNRATRRPRPTPGKSQCAPAPHHAVVEFRFSRMAWLFVLPCVCLNLIGNRAFARIMASSDPSSADARTSRMAFPGPSGAWAGSVTSRCLSSLRAALAICVMRLCITNGVMRLPLGLRLSRLSLALRLGRLPLNGLRLRRYHMAASSKCFSCRSTLATPLPIAAAIRSKSSLQYVARVLSHESETAGRGYSRPVRITKRWMPA
jgi:hypothetical protein